VSVLEDDSLLALLETVDAVNQSFTLEMPTEDAHEAEASEVSDTSDVTQAPAHED
jgi:3-deoxy-D-manno-octulosonic acid (KDO) 8-phosphate synthase